MLYLVSCSIIYVHFKPRNMQSLCPRVAYLKRRWKYLNFTSNRPGDVTPLKNRSAIATLVIFYSCKHWRPELKHISTPLLFMNGTMPGIFHHLCEPSIRLALYNYITNILHGSRANLFGKKITYKTRNLHRILKGYLFLVT